MQAFGVAETDNLRLTNDVDLLTAAVPSAHIGSSILIAIAGTGSVAMRYQWADEQQKYVRVARSGGWGHILGDEGGGYVVGLKAIQYALGAFEDSALGLSNDPDELAMAVSAKLGFPLSRTVGVDLLNDLLAQARTQSAKARIAGVAEVVLGLMGNNTTAAEIVNTQVNTLVGTTIKRLVNPNALGYQSSETSVLILAGGLMKNERYRATFERQLDIHRLHFREKVVVEDAAALGAKYLSR
jgi:N-acetylmuramic acid 6-phosphate etherase